MPQMTNEREYRDFTLEVKVPGTEEEKTMVVEGYASTFNEPYELYHDGEVRILEQVDPNAFDEADMSDVIFQYDHRGRVFARMSNGTLDVNPDEHGLAIRADLGGTDIGKQLYEEIRGGYTTKMSYGYTVAADRWDESRGEDGVLTEIRTITKISKVYDVSAVSLPANDGTSITVRNLTDGVIEKVKAERLKALELRRRKTMMLLELGGF
jgi:HK97 family phage prohead protease